MKKNLLVLVPFIFSVLACSSNNSASGSFSDDNSSSSSSQIINTEYYETPDAPTYKEISEETFNTVYKTFYIDSKNGNDSYSGLDVNFAKKTLSSVEDIISKYSDFSPIRILLKRDSVFYGNVILTGYTATEDYPFVLDAYGEGRLPKIIGEGSNDDVLTNAVVWVQEENTRIYNIEVTGPACTRGIYVLPRKGGIYNNIIIKGCYVHDLNWNWVYDKTPDETHPTDINPEIVTPLKSINRYRRLYGGISFFTGTVDALVSMNCGPIVFNNVFVEDNKIENVSYLGINFYNYWVNRGGIGYGYNKYVEEQPDYQDFKTGIGYFPSRNVVVRNNYTNCIGGDAIVVDGVDGAWLIGNTSYKSSYLGRGGIFNAGIWIHNVRHGYMLYNEAAYTYMQNGSGDAQGFNVDIACEDIHFYYNYSHHNEGGGLLLCNNTSLLFTYNIDGTLTKNEKQRLVGIWNNVYCRNNVFAYNGNTNNKLRSAFITIARECYDFVAEHNTVVTADIPGQHIINCEDTPLSYNHTYRNNIFYSAKENNQVFANQTLSNPLFNNNLYYNIRTGDGVQNELLLEDDVDRIVGLDPQFNIPTELDGYEKCLMFVPNISLLEKANKVPLQLRYDLVGNITTDMHYLGAIVK